MNTMLMYRTPHSVRPLLGAELQDRVKGYFTRAALDLDWEPVVQSVANSLPRVSDEDTIRGLVVEACQNKMITDPGYDRVSVRAEIEHLHSVTTGEMRVWTNQLSDVLDPKVLSFCRRYEDRLQSMLRPETDYNKTLFGLHTLNKSYLRRGLDRRVLERPSTMSMRVALGIHAFAGDLDAVERTYNSMVEGYYTHATPTLTSAAIEGGNYSSCFVLSVDDNLESIVRSWDHCARINSAGGGVAVYLGKLRATGSLIHTTRKMASGLEVMQVYDRICQYIRKSSLRGSSINVAIDVWHPDVYYFLDCKRNVGDEGELTRKLFTQLMINDLFMERVEQDGTWSLFCPSDCPELPELWGDEFRAAYLKREEEGIARKVVSARSLYVRITQCNKDSGLPYLGNKDAINAKSNFTNSDPAKSRIIYCLNMCMEICQPHDASRYTVCNLASLCLPAFCKDGVIDYQLLADKAGELCLNINRIIDCNNLPLKETEEYNRDDRPMGIGVQGMADLFCMMRLVYDGPEARQINRDLAEAIYYGALLESNRLAKTYGHYPNYPGSPASRGELQFDLWGITPSDRWDWAGLKESIKKYGLYNSVVTAYMPTASTSQIMGNHECVEPWSNNIYMRSTNVGQYYMINRYMVRHLQELGLWNEDMIDRIKLAKGSIQNITEIPSDVRAIYRTAWEIPNKSTIEMAADRGPYVDQSQSLNFYVSDGDYPRIQSCQFYAWRLGLKTCMYYLHTRAASDGATFGVDIDKSKIPLVCSRDNPDCIACQG